MGAAISPVIREWIAVSMKYTNGHRHVRYTGICGSEWRKRPLQQIYIAGASSNCRRAAVYWSGPQNSKSIFRFG